MKKPRKASIQIVEKDGNFTVKTIDEAGKLVCNIFLGQTFNSCFSGISNYTEDEVLALIKLCLQGGVTFEKR